MEYVTYSLVIAGILVLCLVLLRDPRQSLAREDKPKAAKPASKTHTLSRETLSVPTPWGWPGHDRNLAEKTPAIPKSREVHDVSESVHRFVDHLISEKQTVEDREYLLKKDASLRALLEDRYGRAQKAPEASEQPSKTQLP